MVLRSTPQGAPLVSHGAGTTPSGGAGTGFGADRQVMSEAVKYVHNVGQVMYDELIRLKRALEALAPQWTGEAQQQFFLVAGEWDTAARNLQRAIDDIGFKMGGTHGDYVGIESDNVSSIKAVGQGLPH